MKAADHSKSAMGTARLPSPRWTKVWLRSKAPMARSSAASIFSSTSMERGPAGRAQNAALPLVPHLEGIVHPGARIGGPDRQVVCQQPQQRLVVGDPLPQDHLGGLVGAVYRLVGRLELDDVLVAFLGFVQRWGVLRAGFLD